MKSAARGLVNQVKGDIVGPIYNTGAWQEKSIGMTITPDEAALIAGGLATAADHTRTVANFPALAGLYDELSSSLYIAAQGQ
jgi:hypothetical protein